MESHDPTSGAGLRSRIDALRRRLVSLHSTGPAEVVPLDHRVLKLSERVRQQHGESARDFLVGLHEPHTPMEIRASSARGASQDSAPRIERLVAEIEPLRHGFEEIANSTYIAREPGKRVLLHRGRQLVELAETMLREAHLSASKQWALLPAFETMLKESSRLFADLANFVNLQQKRAGEMTALRDLHEQLLSGAKIRWQRVADLAQTIIEEASEATHPTIIESISQDAATVVATHGMNVAHVAAFITGLNPSLGQQQLPLTAAGLLMDIGMLESAPGVYALMRGLAVDEWAAVERHPIESKLKIERIVGIDPEVAELASSHHERLDGSGYPAGRRSDEIKKNARLLAAIDVYVARQSYRSYRPALAPAAALTSTLSEVDAGRLDATQVRKLLAISLYPVGSIVELTTREIAEVIAPGTMREQEESAGQPFVMLLSDRRGQPLATPIYRNLAQRTDTHIVRALSREEASLYTRVI